MSETQMSSLVTLTESLVTKLKAEYDSKQRKPSWSSEMFLLMGFIEGIKLQSKE